MSALLIIQLLSPRLELVEMDRDTPAQGLAGPAADAVRLFASVPGLDPAVQQARVLADEPPQYRLRRSS